MEISRKTIFESPISFLKSSGVPLKYTLVVPAATYEGDNSVLLQQTGKFLMNEIQKLKTVIQKLF